MKIQERKPEAGLGFRMEDNLDLEAFEFNHGKKDELTEGTFGVKIQERGSQKGDLDSEWKTI